MGAEVRKIKGQNTMLKKASPFDFIATKRNEGSVFFDAKTRTADRIAYSDFWDKGSTQRQMRTLDALGQFGEKTGFLVWFQASNKISFIFAADAINMKARTSFGPNNGIELGTLENFCIERLWDENELNRYDSSGIHLSR